jgi:hypothetical protein
MPAPMPAAGATLTLRGHRGRHMRIKDAEPDEKDGQLIEGIEKRYLLPSNGSHRHKPQIRLASDVEAGTGIAGKDIFRALDKFIRLPRFGNEEKQFLFEGVLPDYFPKAFRHEERERAPMARGWRGKASYAAA